MGPYLGDFAINQSVHLLWSSQAGDGASITRATNGTISVYKNNGVTQSTSGITDTEDFDSVTGVHAITIDLSADGTFYSAGANFSIVLSGAVIDGKNVNAVLGHFSISNRTHIPQSLSTQARADVNAEVLDVLNVDTFAEPGQGNPPATATLIQKIGYLYKAWRNRTTQTATTLNLYADDATTVDQKATVSDNGTTFERTEIATGP